MSSVFEQLYEKAYDAAGGDRKVAKTVVTIFGIYTGLALYGLAELFINMAKLISMI